MSLVGTVRYVRGEGSGRTSRRGLQLPVGKVGLTSHGNVYVENVLTSYEPIIIAASLIYQFRVIETGSTHLQYVPYLCRVQLYAHVRWFSV